MSEYIIDRNAKQAAIRSNYSEKTAESQGSRLLSNVKVMNAIDKLLEQRQKRTLITADYILNSLKSVAERCMQKEAILDRNGEPTGEYKFDSAGATRSLELLGKNQKLFTDKTEIAGANGEPLKLDIKIDYGDEHTD